MKNAVSVVCDLTHSQSIYETDRSIFYIFVLLTVFFPRKGESSEWAEMGLDNQEWENAKEEGNMDALWAVLGDVHVEDQGND